MPQPSLMMSITGPAICAHSADDYEVGQAVSRCCGIDNGTRAQIHRAGEVAQSTARALCLAVFAGLGVLYFQHWVVQKPFGIILIIGEGLAPERIALTRVYLGGSDAHL